MAGKIAPAAPGGAPGSAASDTLYGLQGYIPASTLNEEGAAYTAAARQLPGIAESQGLQQIGKVQAAQQKADADFATQIGQITGKVPELRLQVSNDLFNQQYKSKDLALRQQTAAFNEKAQLAKYKTSIDEFNARQALSTSRLQWEQANADRAYGLAYDKFIASQRKAADKQRTLSPTAFNGVTYKANKDAFSLYHGIPAVTKTVSGQQVVTKPAVPALTYQQSIRRLTATYPALGAAGAIKILNTYYQPGEGGRPAAPTPFDTGIGGWATKIAGTATSAASSSPVVKAASLMLGTPYVWGGNTPGKALDCSGFLQQTYKLVGVNLPRTTYQQVKAGQPVSLNDLQPGDAIFTIPSPQGPKHVGMYIGNDLVQVSPSSGDVNKVVSLKDYLSLGFVAARRYIGG